MYKIKQIADEVIIPAIETEDPEKKLARRFLYFLLNLYHQHFDEEEGREELAMWAKLLYNLKRNVKDEELASKLESTIVELKYYIPVLTGYAALKTRKFDEG